MKLIMENWRSFLQEQTREPLWKRLDTITPNIISAHDGVKKSAEEYLKTWRAAREEWRKDPKNLLMACELDLEGNETKEFKTARRKWIQILGDSPHLWPKFVRKIRPDGTEGKQGFKDGPNTAADGCRNVAIKLGKEVKFFRMILPFKVPKPKFKEEMLNQSVNSFQTIPEFQNLLSTSVGKRYLRRVVDDVHIAYAKLSPRDQVRPPDRRVGAPKSLTKEQFRSLALRPIIETLEILKKKLTGRKFMAVLSKKAGASESADLAHQVLSTVGMIIEWAWINIAGGNERKLGEETPAIHLVKNFSITITDEFNRGYKDINDKGFWTMLEALAFFKGETCERLLKDLYQLAKKTKQPTEKAVLEMGRIMSEISIAAKKHHEDLLGLSQAAKQISDLVRGIAPVVKATGE